MVLLSIFNPNQPIHAPSASMWEETEETETSDFSRGEPLTLQMKGVHSVKPTIIRCRILGKQYIIFRF